MTIYKITCLVDNKIYIGQTVKKIKTRWTQHLCQVKYVGGSNRKICRYLHTAIKKYGPENFKIEPLYVANSIEDLNEKEIFYIKTLNSLAPNGYNLQTGGQSRGVSDETRKLLSEKTSGHKNGMFGKSGSEKQKQWLNEFNKKPRTEEFRKNCIKAQKLRSSLGLNKGFTRKKTSEEVEKTRLKLLKTFKFKSPNGEIFLIKDVHAFAEKHLLSARSLRRAFQKKKPYKGWEPVYV